MTKANKRVIAVSGCKGGVGKTVVAVNLALVLARLGQRVVLMDGDLSVPDIKTTLGLSTKEMNGLKKEDFLSFSLAERCPDTEVFSDAAEVRVFTPKAEDVWKDDIKVAHAVELIQDMDDLASDLDTLIIDTAPGLAPDNVTLIQAATEIIVVINQEDVSIVDAARQIKLLHHVFNVHQFYIVVNLVSSRRGGAKQFEKLQENLKNDSQIILSYLGAVPHDKAVGEATLQQSALLSLNNDCRAARALHRIGYQLTKIPVPEPKGRIEFFLPGRIKERV